MIHRPRMTHHWKQRVRERIGNVDPKVLWDGIVWALENNRTDLVEYVCRVNKNGLRAFRFRTPDERFWVALVNTKDGVPVTVLSGDQSFRTHDGHTVEVAAHGGKV